MLWAARASATFAIASIVAESDTAGDPPASLVPALMLLGWIDVELRLLPESLDVIRLIRGCRKSLPLDEDRKSTRLNSSYSCAYRMPSSACTKQQTPHKP